MKIQFDNTALLAGIGLVPWTRLGPERWFTNYKIASLYGWDLQDVAGAPEVIALADNVAKMPHLSKFNTQQLLKTPAFQELIAKDFPEYDFLTYRSTTPPEVLTRTQHKFLSPRVKLTTTLENKVEFRAQFASLDLPFPSYTVVNRADCTADQKTLQALLGGRKRVIVQDEILSGGRGTFVVHNVSSLSYALHSLAMLGGAKRLVISEMIERAHERSVQCVVTRYGTFVGPLQKQLIADPLLANLAVPDGDKFCGGEVSAADPLNTVYLKIRSYALRIGERLQQLGYRGIFSVDCLVDQAETVYVLEINPRLTGMTPLLTALYREGKDIPFYLLHILELANMDYTITNDTVADTPPEGSLMVVHSQENTTAQIAESPVSGLYTRADVSYVSQEYRLDGNTQHMLVQQYTPPGFKIKPGGRLMMILTNSVVTNDNDQLLPDIRNSVSNLMGTVRLKRVEI